MISIHALRVEGDLNWQGGDSVGHRFLSTPSGWRATIRCDLVLQLDVHISIHALRVEGDYGAGLLLSAEAAEFLSTPSGWRATRTRFPHNTRRLPFLSTPSGWRATAEKGNNLRASDISIHALRVEGDRRSGGIRSSIKGISIHALRVEGDKSNL